MRMHFSSGNVGPGARRAAIEAAFRSHVDGTVDFPSDAPPSVDMDFRLLGSVHVAAIETAPIRLTTRAEEDGLFYLSVTAVGGGVIDAKGAGREVHAGDINVMRRDHGCTTIVAEQSEILSIAIPKVLLVPRLAASDAVHGSTLASMPAARLLQNYAGSLLGDEDIGAAEQALFASHIVDLAALMLGANRDAQQDAKKSGVRAARRRAIKADIAAQLTNPDLSLDWIARRHRLSGAYVRALFYDEGASFTDYVLNERLDHARCLLASPYLTDQNIATLALMAGFGDISWFNQSFRRRFGLKPSDVRRDSREADPPPSPQRRLHIQ